MFETAIHQPVDGMQRGLFRDIPNAREHERGYAFFRKGWPLCQAGDSLPHKNESGARPLTHRLVLRSFRDFLLLEQPFHDSNAVVGVIE